MAVGKKWYSYFVVTDDSSAAAGPGAAGPPQRAADQAGEAAAETLFADPASSAVDLEVVYEAAKIAAPAHGYTVLKVAEMLENEHIRTLPADVKRKSIMVALDAAHVKVAEVVEDAVRRDRALDTYERVLKKRLDQLGAEAAAENTRIEEEIAQRVAELRARIDENTRKLDRERIEFLAWQTRKHREEATIADAVSYFVSENPISTSSANDKGDADVR